ncbi:MAG TPA: flagellar basal body P-ring formation chaperone FlgA [Burkholderiaceae bacterium]|nr:flagellar basal body P-ring formation chaperone FlgA [Burkholderiaceae bacterium]
MSVFAQQSPLQQSAHLFALREAARIAGGTQSRIDVQVGELDSRLQLAPCAKTETFLPRGVRLWGRAVVGVRCVDPNAGAPWSITLPVTVRVYGPALVATRALAAGTPIAATDVRSEEVEWTREAQGVATDFAQLAERVPARTLAAGQPIPLAALRAAQAVGQGDLVRVVGRGQGFSITTDGVALASALDGQPVRVRTDNGKVITGTARTGRIVELTF